MAQLAEVELAEVERGMDLKFPWMREELIGHLEELADVELQTRTWKTDRAHLSDPVHFLFDDTPAPSEALGYYLQSQGELAAVLAVVAALDSLMTTHGPRLTDREYMEKPEWSSVTAAARAALDLLSGSAS
jgi:hypothetical protein